MYTAKHMKWWGWGDEEVSFNSSTHPGLWPYAKAVLGVEEEHLNRPPVALEAVRLRGETLDVRVLGLLSIGVDVTAAILEELVGVPEDEVTFLVAGVNTMWSWSYEQLLTMMFRSSHLEAVRISPAA